MESSQSSCHTTSYDESRPLLPDQQALESQQSVEANQTPLPKIQLAVLCFLRLLDPLAFTQIFPYINQFMDDLRLTNDPSQIGFYSGVVESAFAISQLLATYPWGWISDMFGRRSVILAGATGLAVTTLLFGLSRNFASVLATRFLAGLFSGNVAVIPSVLCEITDNTNQALAFPIFGLFWPIGAIIGPLIGGNLSNPATKYPMLFDYKFLRTYPYFLPCVVSSMVAAFGVILSYFFLEETLRPMDRTNGIKDPTSYDASDDPGECVDADKTPSIKTLLSIPNIRALCASGCALSFISTAFDVVFVLFCYSPIQTGGLALSVSQIGYSLATAGAIAASLQLFFMPTLLRRFNHARIYKICMGIWPCTFTVLPALNIIARRGFDETTGILNPWTTSMLWVRIGLVLSMARVAFLAYSVNMLLVKKYSPNPSSLGSTMGLVQCCICLSRAFSPAFVSSAFAISTSMNILGGYLWAFTMVVICVGACPLSRHIV